MKTLIKINAAFTLVEVMVSSALIVVIMGFLMYTMEQTQRTMRGADSKIGQFQTARVAFEALTRNLSQATLNTFWDLDFEKNKAGKVTPTGYRRNSDLHFISGLASSPQLLDSDESKNPTHAVFFQAPLGVSYLDDKSILSPNGYEKDQSLTDDSSKATESKRKYRFLNNLINVCGYYIQWEEDKNIPTFIKKENFNDKKSMRYRYRLSEVIQPAETVSIYNNLWFRRPNLAASNFTAPPNAGAFSPLYENATDWIRVATGRMRPSYGPQKDYTRPLAENVVALIILPKLSPSDRKDKTRLDDLTSDYNYDSRPQSIYDANFTDGTDTVDSILGAHSIAKKQYAQLPPILQVTIVAIDEDSGARLEASLSVPEKGPEEHWSHGLFKNVGNEIDFLNDIGNPATPSEKSLSGRLSGLDKSIKLPKMNYRIFTTDVVLRGSKWTNSN